ncbi:MAG: hypothetical protein V2I27_02090 [Erythrobacter sp.]|nr:hypothetical protein [Erythrobacter sp.]
MSADAGSGSVGWGAGDAVPMALPIAGAPFAGAPIALNADGGCGLGCMAASSGAAGARAKPDGSDKP